MAFGFLRGKFKGIRFVESRNFFKPTDFDLNGRGPGFCEGSHGGIGKARGEGADDDGCAHAARVLQLVGEVHDVDAGVWGWCCRG